MNNKASLTVFFENPFWVGLFQKEANGKLEVCRVVFGSEPTDSEILDFISNNYSFLKFSKPIELQKNNFCKKVSAKRKIKEAKKEMGKIHMATKAQVALQLQYEEKKRNLRTQKKIKKCEEKTELFNLKTAKRKEKHRGH